MSRCFPFPPPGYVLNGVRDVAMIESIKGEEDKCKKEQRRKERKRDKNEKKDKKNKKRKERERGEGESQKHSHKRRRTEEVAKDVQNNQKVDVLCKLKESENDYLGKSSITIERELLQSTSQNSCDSTLNSNEKEKKKQPLDGRHNNNDCTLNSNLLPKEKEKQPLDGKHGDSESIIRIRLPIRRPKDSEVMMMMTNKDQPCPSREIKLDTSQSEQPHHPCSTSAPQNVSKPHEVKRKDHTSTKKHKEKKLPCTIQETCQPSRGLCRFCPPSVAVQFLNVVENWVPSPIESTVELTNYEGDESWWLMKKQSSNKITERCKQLNRNNEIKKVISSSIEWPRARFLPEADVYTLPYTVPF